jgi:4-amino-4-deoxy-L-arabinose transferase-like glycosyltransferase
MKIKILLDIKNDPILPIFIIATILYVLLTLTQNSGNILSLILGIASFILIPGYLLGSIIARKIHLDIIGYSFILGLALAIVNVAIYSILSFYGAIDFDILLISSTVVVITILRVIAFKLKISLSINTMKNQATLFFKNPVFYIFIFSFIIRLLFSSNNTTSILPDASLYLDISRTIASHGVFSSHVIYDELLGTLTSNGLIEHSFITFIFAIFFSFYNSTLATGLLAVVFIGSFLVFPVYDLTKELFNKKTALVASIIIAIHPIFIYFSSILFGPEITALMFILTSLFLIVAGSKNKCKSALLLGGLLLGISEEIWWAQFYIIILIIPIILVAFLYNKDANRKPKILYFFFASFVVLLYAFSLKIYSLYFIYIPVVIFEFIVFFIYLKKRSDGIYAQSFVIGIIIPSFLSVVRHYIFPSQVAQVIENMSTAGLLPSIYNAFTLYLHGSFINGMSDYSLYIINYASLAIMIFFFFSFIIIKDFKSKLIIVGILFLDFVLISSTPPTTYPLYLSSQGRYYLLPIVLTVLGCSYFLTHIEEATSNKNFNLKIRFIGKTKNIAFSYLVFVFLTSAILISSFSPAYNVYAQYINDENPLQKYNWSDNLITWITQNTAQDSVFLTSRARELAWLTSRQTVSIFNSSLASKDIGFNQLNAYSKTFAVSYILSDSYLYANVPKLRSLCYPNMTIGEKMIPDDEIIAAFTNQELNGYSFELVYSDNSSARPACVWKLIPGSQLLLDVKPVDLMESNWLVGNGLKDTTAINSTKIEIGEGKQYAYTFSNITLGYTNVANSTGLFIWQISEIKDVKITRIELWANGTQILNLQPESKTGIWFSTYNAARLDDFRIVISGVPNGYIVIDSLAIGSYSVST